MKKTQINIFYANFDESREIADLLIHLMKKKNKQYTKILNDDYGIDKLIIAYSNKPFTVKQAQSVVLIDFYDMTGGGDCGCPDSLHN